MQITSPPAARAALTMRLPPRLGGSCRRQAPPREAGRSYGSADQERFAVPGREREPYCARCGAVMRCGAG
jgi:hypothetical protein